MKVQPVAFPALILISIAAWSSAAAQTSPPSFAITAANVTLASSTSGGMSAYTVSGIPMTGTLLVTCAYSGPATTAKIPICGAGHVIAQIPVTAGQTVTGTASITPWGTPTPANDSALARHAPSLAFLLGGVFLLGLGLRGRGRRWLSAVVLAAWATASILTVGACGGSSNPFAMTPGTYAYTITASNSSNAATPLSQGVSSTFTVTVP